MRTRSDGGDGGGPESYERPRGGCRDARQAMSEDKTGRRHKRSRAEPRAVQKAAWAGVNE